MGDSPCPRHDTAPGPGVSIEVGCVPVVGVALARAGVPVVPGLTLTGGPAQGVTVTVQLRTADGPLGRPVELTADVNPARPTVLGDVGLLADPHLLAAVTEPCTGTVEVRVEGDGRLLGSSRTPVRVLPAGQWLAAPTPLALELLAAHVLPDDPAVAGLVGAAADLLRLRTGDPTVDAGPSDAQRIDETAEAIVAAMLRRGIRHRRSVTGWSDVPQRVRTPGEVLEDRAATSLDATVTLAAALEHAGIRPLLWVTTDHAFLGYWRVDRCADSAASTDVAALAELVGRGQVQLVETSLLESTAEPATFGDLHRTAVAGWLTGDLSRVLGVTDVHRARLDGIAPLPLPQAAGQLTAHRPARRAGTRAPGGAAAPETPFALLDLDRPAADPDSGALRLTVPAGRLGALVERITAGAPVTLLPVDQLGAAARQRGIRTATDLPPHQLEELLVGHGGLYADVCSTDYASRVGAVADREQTLREETGRSDLHLALGSLTWAGAGRPVRSPLVLVPVVLNRAPGTGAYRLTLDPAGAITPNSRLLGELDRWAGLAVPALSAPGTDGPDPAAAVAELRQELARRGLPGRVEPTADLVLAPVAPIRVQADADRLGAAALRNPLVPVLLRSGQPFLDPVPAPDVDLAELSATLPLPAGEAQLRAVAAGAAGRTFVLVGTPGTGKTQTAADLVVAAVTGGKRVLVLAPRPAELDVVAERLAAAGLGPLTLGLHRATNPAAVRAQLLAAADGAGPGPADQLPAELPAELRAVRSSLADYADRLHAPSAAGPSLYTAHTALLTTGPGTAALPVPTSFATDASTRTVAAIRRQLAALPSVAARTQLRPGSPWGFIDAADADPVAVHAAVTAVDSALAALPSAGPLARVVAAVPVPDLAAVATVLDGPAVPLAELDAVRSPGWAQAVDELLAATADLTGTPQPGLDVADPRALDLALPGLAADAEQAADSGRFGRGKRLAAVLAELAPVLRPGARVEPTEVPALLADLVAVQSSARELAERAGAVAGLRVPWHWNPFTDPLLVDRQVAQLRRLSAALAGPDSAAHLRRFLDTAPVPDAARAGAVRNLLAALSALPAACTTPAEHLASWAGDVGPVPRWEATAEERAVEEFGLPSLGRWLEVLHSLQLLGAAGLTGARTALLTGAVPAADAVAAFDRGFAEASSAERTAAARLTAADAVAQEGAVRRLLAGTAARRVAVAADVPARTRAARPVVDRVPDAVGVRALLADPAGAALTPCVLATPDAAARFLPATAGSFDLVVVDGATQLPVRDALGALGRARSAVVVGDVAGLLPAAAVDEAPAEDLLTACLRAGVPRQELTWQLRTEDDSLVAALPPGRRTCTVPGPGRGQAVSLVRVDGAFARTGAQRQTNPAEAAAVAAEVCRRFADSPDGVPSLLVLTLHPPQRRLIEALLRGTGGDRVVAALDGGELLVRPAAAVAGQERDVVLLSLGCSPDRRGRLPLEDLGPLSRAGGGQVLAGAVTRARRQVVVFASFAPSAVQPETTSQAGVRRLRSYLDAADAVPQEGARVPDAHCAEIAGALRDRGLVVATDVGRSAFRIDLTVARPDAPEQALLAVLLDGPAWAARPAVERDELPAAALAAHGWPAVERVWLPAWLADRETVLDRLVAAVAAAVAPAQLLPAPTPVAAPALPEATADPVARGLDAEPVRVVARPAVTAVRLEGERPFRFWTPERAGDPGMLRRLGDPEVARLVRRVLAAGIEAEGPVHRDRLATLTAAAFGVPRVNAARIDSLVALLPDPSAEFCWPSSLDRATWTGFRRQAGNGERPLEHVPPQEIGNAMVALCRAGAGMTRDELFQQTLAVFGHRRRHPVLVPYLEEALASVVRAAQVVRDGPGQLITAA